MTDTFHSPPAYPRLLHHPLAAAMLAIFWATLLVIGVAGASGFFGGAAFASGGADPSHGAGDQHIPADAP